MARVDFDRFADKYGAGRRFSDDAVSAWRDAVAPYLTRNGLPLVDIGSGTGRFSALLAEWFAVDVIAVEPSAGMRDEARRNSAHPRVSYLGGDGEHVPLRQSSAGCAWLSTVIHHIPDLAACARELRRVLAPDARVLDLLVLR